jgi:N4-gp56 family major capsid protein
MAINNFVSTVWAAKVLENLQKSLVFGGVCNRDYEGDIRDQGSQVHIHSFNPTTVGTYTKNSTVVTPEVLNDSRQTLLIDRSRYIAFKVDDVDAAQQKPKIMSAATRQAAYDLAQDADAFLAGLYTGGTAVATSQFTAANVYDKFVDASVTLDQNNIPEEGRFAIVPPWVAGLLLKNANFINSKDGEIIYTGEIGRVAGLRILKSNNVVQTGSAPVIHHMWVGHPIAVTFANQLNKVVAYEPEESFSDAIKMLHLYGAKVVRATGLLDLQANI